MASATLGSSAPGLDIMIVLNSKKALLCLEEEETAAHRTGTDTRFTLIAAAPIQTTSQQVWRKLCQENRQGIQLNRKVESTQVVLLHHSVK